MLFKKILILLAIVLLFLMISTTCSGDAIERIENNLKVTIADIIMIIASCGIIVVGAFDTRIAIMFAFLLYTVIFIVFTLATEEGYENFNPYFSGLAMMVCFIILCLMLLVSYKKANTPLNVV